MTDDANPRGDQHDPVLTDQELDRLLQSWQVGRPSPGLEERLFDSYRARRSHFRAGLLAGTIRVPLWFAAACLALFLVMAPLAIRGLGSRTPEREEAPNRGTSFVEIRGGARLDSMTTTDSASMENYITVADLSELQPTKHVNLKVFRAEETKK